VQGQQFHGDHPAQRIADHVGFGYAQVAHQPHDVLDHLHAVLVFGFRLVGLPVAPVIEGDDLVVLSQRGNSARQLPIHSRAGIKPMDEDDRFALTLDHIVNLHAVGRELIRVERGCAARRYRGAR